MTNQQPLLNAYINKDLQTTIVCPECRISRTISVAAFCGKKQDISIRCKCNYVFRIHLEFRNHYRKETSLPARYNVLRSRGGTGRTTVVNLSLGGASFLVRKAHDFRVGDRGELEFTLDHYRQLTISRQFIIRSITEAGKRIGCQFIGGKAREKDLGFYLLH